MTYRSPTSQRPIDWWRVIVDLCYNGHTHKTIGIYVGVGKSTIVGWKDGSCPRHHDGEALLDLWCSMTGNIRADAPRS